MCLVNLMNSQMLLNSILYYWVRVVLFTCVHKCIPISYPSYISIEKERSQICPHLFSKIALISFSSLYSHTHKWKGLFLAFLIQKIKLKRVQEPCLIAGPGSFSKKMNSCELSLVPTKILLGSTIAKLF